MAEVLGPDEDREIDRLRRALMLGKGPAFHMIVGDTRRVVDAALARVLPGVKPPQETVAPEQAPKEFAVRWMKWLEAAIHEGGAQPVVLDAWDVDPEHEEHWGWIFARLSERRNEIMRGLGRPLLLLVSPDNERLLGHMGPDLWSVRGVGMRLRDRGVVTVDRSERDIQPTPTPTGPSQAEVEHQRQRLARARSGPTPIGPAIESLRLAQMLHESSPHRGLEALALAEQAIAHYEASSGEDDTARVDLARALQLHAVIAAGMGRRQEGIEDLQRSIAILDELAAQGPDHSAHSHDLARAHATLGDLHRALGRPEEARSFDEGATAIRREIAEHRPVGGDVRRSMSTLPSVFISYSHDSGEHDTRVLALADQLRSDGVDVRLDQYAVAPPEGWPSWIRRQVVDADFVVIVCTPTYRRRFEGEEQPGAGPGVAWEAMLAQQLLYEAGARNHRLIPVVFEDADPAREIPLALRAYTHYRLGSGYDDLYRRITQQPRRPPPPIGQLRTLPPDPRLGFPSGNIRINNDGATIGQQITVHGNAAFGTVAVTTPQPQVGAHATILLFTANSTDTARRLELEEELREISNALQRSRHRDHYSVVISPAVTFTQVIHDLDDHDPAIVHFGGHGDRSGELILKGSATEDQHIPPEHIDSLLGALRNPPTLVVFATCNSDRLAAAAAKHARFAIGFRQAVEDKLLPPFAAVLYERLAAHAAPDIARAFTLAKLAAAAAGFETADQACLFERSGEY